MSSTVLVPVDGSPLSRRALRYALESFPDAEIVAYHVTDLFGPSYGPDGDLESAFEPMVGTDAWDARVRERTEQLFADLEAVAADHDRSITTESDVGDPARLVLEHATEEPVDHVVIGSHGRPNARRPMVGSVADSVVRRAPTTVTVVR